MRTKHVIRLAIAGLFIVNLALVAVFVTATPGTAQAQASQTVNIEIKDFKFGPDTLTIPVGTKVIWTNKDSVGHTVTSATAGAFGSDLLKQNATFEFTFTKAGTYDYACQPHPFMRGKIEVTEAVAPVTTAAAVATTVAAATTTAPAMAATTMPAMTSAMTTSSAMVAGTTMASAMTTTSGAAMSAPSATTSTSSSSNDSGSTAFIIVGAVIVLALAGGGFFLLRGRATR